MNIWKIGAVLLGVTALSLLAAACGGSADKDETPPPSAKERTITVEVGEFYFAPDVITVKEGERVHIELVNKGSVAHEFMVGREVEMHGDVPEGFEHDFFDGMSMDMISFEGVGAELEMKEGHGTEVYVEAGGHGTLSFIVPAGSVGEWEFACYVPGHYGAGQRGRFVVEND